MKSDKPRTLCSEKSTLDSLSSSEFQENTFIFELALDYCEFDLTRLMCFILVACGVVLLVKDEMNIFFCANMQHFSEFLE